MPDLTPRIGIKKPLGNENVTRASFNENWDLIDASVATLGIDGKVPADQLSVQAAASLTVAGVTKLNSATNSVDETTAATPKAVKAAYDLANTANSKSFNPLTIPLAWIG